MLKLNLGCGRDYREGYVNLDISPDVGADIVWNVTHKLPFKDNEFSEIIANNVLTQILEPQRFLQVMNDLWRICNGEMLVRVPLVTDPCAWQDPMDCRRFTDQSFTYMEEGHRRYEQYGKHYGFQPWKVEVLENNGKQMKLKLCPVKN